MKKFMFVLVAVVLLASLALAQTPVTAGTQAMTTGSGSSVAPAVDVLGAHNNYGRGCAGCHAPHSGAKGAGGNAGTGTATDAYTGDNALFGQDMGPLFGQTFYFGDTGNYNATTSSFAAGSYTFTAPSSGAGAYANSQSDLRGIVMCLACHDGAVAKGAMMQNYAYEQQIGALPTSYGAGHIPTLLGADGTTALLASSDGGNYNNDHPVGENASLMTVTGGYPTPNVNITAANGTVTNITFSASYQKFQASYGSPVFAASPWTPGAYNIPASGSTAYVVCTTCHNQHVMNVFSATSKQPIANSATGTYATFFFINSPYNLNTVSVAAGKANTTTQFCRQCHFGESNEANGGTLPTQF